MQTRFQGCWSGIRRGARFGALIGIIIWLLVNVVGWIVALVVPSIREHAMADLAKGWERWGPLSVIGSLIATFGLMATYGALGGMFVMGMHGFLKPGQVKAQELDDATVDTIS